MKKRLLSLALSLVMLLGVFSAFPVIAGETAYTNTVSMESLYNGDKTVVADTVYSISSVDELYWFAELCTLENDYFAGATVILAQDITMNEGWTASSDVPTGDDAKTWEPIPMFKGIFDGQDNTISGFYQPTGINWKAVVPASDVTAAGGNAEQAGGIFASVGGDNTTIKNLKVENSYFSSEAYSGAIAGVVTNRLTHSGMLFKNIDVSAIVETTKASGAGGVVALLNGSDRTSVITLEDCTFTGSVTVKVERAGGIVGVAMCAFSMINCVNNGQISALSTDTTSNAYDPEPIGGLMGSISAQGNVSFDGCINNGDVFINTTPYGTCIGGMVGYSNRPMTITNCTNNGDLYATALTANVRIGGMIGRAYSTLTVQGSVNNGELYTESATTATQIGGIVGYGDQAVTIEDSANTAELSMKRADAVVDTKLTTSQMGGIVAFVAEGKVLTATRCANVGDIKVAAATTDTNNGGVEIGGIVGCSKGNGMTLTDCLFAGDISARASTTGGIISTYQRFNGVLKRCVVIGTISEIGSGTNSSGSFTDAYRGALVGNLNNSDNTTFEDCVYNSTLRALPSWVGIKSGLTEFTITVKTAGMDDLTTTYTAGVNPTVVINNLVSTGASKTVSSMTDLNAVKNLTTLDWADKDSGWQLEQVNGTYLPVPASVAKLIALQKAEKSNGVDYHAVQNTSVSGETLSVRFISTVDDLERGKIGFEVIIIKSGTYATHTLEDGTVYTALTYGDLSDTASENELYEVDGKYLGALVFEDVPATGVVTFEVKAFSETDGTRSYDDAYIVVFNNGAYAQSYRK